MEDDKEELDVAGRLALEVDAVDVLDALEGLVDLVDLLPALTDSLEEDLETMSICTSYEVVWRLIEGSVLVDTSSLAREGRVASVMEPLRGLVLDARVGGGEAGAPNLREALRDMDGVEVALGWISMTVSSGP